MRKELLYRIERLEQLFLPPTRSEEEEARAYALEEHFIAIAPGCLEILNEVLEGDTEPLTPQERAEVEASCRAFLATHR